MTDIKQFSNENLSAYTRGVIDAYLGDLPTAARCAVDEVLARFDQIVTSKNGAVSLIARLEHEADDLCSYEGVKVDGKRLQHRWGHDVEAFLRRYSTTLDKRLLKEEEDLQRRTAEKEQKPTEVTP